MSALSSSVFLSIIPAVKPSPSNLGTHYRFLSICSPKCCGSSEIVVEPEAHQSSQNLGFGFNNLIDTFWVHVQSAEGRPFRSRVYGPETLGEEIENVAIRIELSNGCVGWGEVPISPPSITLDQSLSLIKVKEVSEYLRKRSSTTLISILDEIDRMLPGTSLASVRAGVEMALIDALANSLDVPLWRLFGGCSNALTTSITIPFVSSAEAVQLAANYSDRGINIFKFNVGKDLNSEIEVLRTILAANPGCSFILDANESFNPEEAIEALGKLYDMGVIPAVFEQPVKRNDWSGLSYVSKFARDAYGICVAADESCRHSFDVEKIAKTKAADVINIKLAKFGVLGALEIVDTARRSGLGLMIDTMVETRLGTGFAGHFAAGLGCFRFANLDAPLHMTKDPILGGYEVCGATYRFLNTRGQGCFLKWDIADSYERWSNLKH